VEKNRHQDKEEGSDHDNNMRGGGSPLWIKAGVVHAEKKRRGRGLLGRGGVYERGGELFRGWRLGLRNWRLAGLAIAQGRGYSPGESLTL